MTTPPRYFRIILLATFAGVVAISFCIWWLSRQMKPLPPVELPSENEIESITARINDLEESMGILPIPTFNIPPEHFEIVLSALTPTKRYEYPASWEKLTLGQVEITTKGGQTIKISFCEGGDNSLCFSVDGIRCVRGGQYKPVFVSGDDEHYSDESTLFYNILRSIYQKTVKGKESDNLQRWVETLRRSKGERPPERR